MTDLALRVLIGLLPVMVFLLFLILLDSYKLVRLRELILVILAGGLLAFASYLLNGLLLDASDLNRLAYSRYLAPIIEELLKASVVIALLRAHRIGFHVDAAIFGFAVGAGFAWVENVYYLSAMPEASLAVWVVRGFGTAIMHGAATAIFALIAKWALERSQHTGLLLGLAILLPILIHSVFNHFFVNPLKSALAVVCLLPPLVVLVFRRSERSLEEWLGSGLDHDVQMLTLIHSGEFTKSNPGIYLQALTRRFSGAVVADMLCYLRVHLELAVRAKGQLMMRESGFIVPIEPETKAKFEELKYLKDSIGATGKLAMKPVLHASGRDLWQLQKLERG